MSNFSPDVITWSNPVEEITIDTKRQHFLPVAGCTMLAAAPNARFFCSVFGKDPPTGIYDHSFQILTSNKIQPN